MAHKLIFLHRTGSAEVGVTAADQAELIRVDVQIHGQVEPAFEDLAQETIPRLGRTTVRERAVLEHLELTQRIIRLQRVEQAFGAAFVLKHLGQALVAGALFCSRRILRVEEHQPRAEIAVVGHDDGVAALATVTARVIEGRVEPLCGGLINEGDRQLGHDFGSKQHVAMDVPRLIARGPAGPLIADEGGEFTGFQVICRRVLNILPGCSRCGPALRAVLTAESHPVGLLAGPVVEPVVRTTWPVAKHTALPRIVAGELRVQADFHLAEQLRMVRHHGEVERAGQLQTALRLAIHPRLHAERRPLRKGVCLMRRCQRALRRGIQRVLRVHMEITEERLPLRREVRTGFRNDGRCQQSCR